MNDTGSPAPGASLLPDSTGTITIIHLVLIAIVALAAIAIMVIGRRRKRARIDAERAFDERVAEEQTAPPPPSPSPQVVAAPPPPAAPPLPREEVAPATAAPRIDEAPPAPDRLADEPVAAAAPADASPAAEALPEAAPAAAETPADGPVTQLKGLGPKVALRLAELGISRVGQIAALSDDEAARLDRELGPFAGRLSRDRWIEQARFLAAGDREGFEAVFGRL